MLTSKQGLRGVGEKEENYQWKGEKEEVAKEQKKRRSQGKTNTKTFRPT